MHILITGATGFIGTALSKKLLQDGHSLVALSTRPQERNRLPDTSVQAISWQLPVADLAKVLETCDAVINLAGADISARSWSASYKKIMEDSRILTTQKLVEAIRLAGNKPKVFIQGSAIGFYGNHPAQTFDEESPRGRGYLPDLVERWENAANPLTEMGIRVVWIRTGVVIGRNGGMLKALEPAFRLFAGGPPGNGKQWFSWIALRDEVNAVLFLLDQTDLSGMFNLTAPEPMQIKDFLKVFGKVMNRPSWLPLPRPALRLFLGERADALLLASQKVIPKRLTDNGFQFEFPEANKALGSMYS
ncbi:MAG: TIGR01777 family oxidoreductase [Bacteroidetes bacterium]|nr:TIGR01777 family oxidoreductase [Bacteroidota bacterium]